MALTVNNLTFDKPYVLIGLSIITLGLIIASGLFFLTILFLIGAFSYVYNRKYKGVPIGAELVTMTTLIAGVTYGPFVGLIFGTITAIAAYKIGDDYGATVPFYVIAAAAVGFFAGIAPLPILAIVILTSAFTAFFGEIPSWLGAAESKLYAGLTFVTHIPFSLMMWKILGQYLYLIIRA